MNQMISIRPVLFTLVLAFLLFDMGLSSQTEALAGGSHYAMVTSGLNCHAGGCQDVTTASQCTHAQKQFQPQAQFWKVDNWGNGMPSGCAFRANYWYVNAFGSSSAGCSNPNAQGKYACACICPDPTPAPTRAPTRTPTSTPTSTPTTSTPTSAPTTLAPTETACQTLKGEIKEKCGGESPVNKVIQKAQDAVDTSPQDPMVDLGEYKLSDLEKEQKEGTCGFAKSDPAYLATELVLKITKLSTLV